MKKKRLFVLKITTLMSVIFISLLARAQVLLDENTACDSTGCVIFEVTVKLNSFVDSPTQAISHHSEGDGLNYQTIVVSSGDTCTKQVKVPRPIYDSITAIMASTKGSSSEPPPILTPTQQSILLFYSTLMQQTLNFQCTPKDLQIDKPDNVTVPEPGSGEQETVTIVYSGYIQKQTLKALLKQDGHFLTVVIGEEIFDGWVVDNIETKPSRLVLKKGDEVRKILQGGSLILKKSTP